MIYCTYGLDPAINHGAAVRGHWQVTKKGQLLLESYDVVLLWSQTQGERVAIEEMYGMADHMISCIQALPAIGAKVPLLMGVDWDDTSIYWQARRLQTLRLAQYIGWVSKSLAIAGIRPVWITPAKVRAHMGLKPREKKLVVLERFFERISCDIQDDPEHDVADALLLSYITLFERAARWQQLTLPASSLNSSS
jgi:hypothetical protein